MNDGQIAQLVEQWTENPCVGGSTPSLSTIRPQAANPRTRGAALPPAGMSNPGSIAPPPTFPVQNLFTLRYEYHH